MKNHSYSRPCQKLISNGAFKNGVSQIINNEFAGMLALAVPIPLEERTQCKKSLKTEPIPGMKMDILEYLQAKLITAGRL